MSSRATNRTDAHSPSGQRPETLDQTAPGQRAAAVPGHCEPVELVLSEARSTRTRFTQGFSRFVRYRADQAFNRTYCGAESASEGAVSVGSAVRRGIFRLTQGIRTRLCDEPVIQAQWRPRPLRVALCQFGRRWSRIRVPLRRPGARRYLRPQRADPLRFPLCPQGHRARVVGPVDSPCRVSVGISFDTEHRLGL